MIHKIFKIIVFFAVLFSSSSAYAVAEAEFKKLTKTWQLNEDGSQNYRCQMELTLFTHTAMNSTYGESFVTYNPRYQEIIINSSYTKQKDGTCVKTPANAFVEVLPKNAADAPAYNHLREMVIVHTGLELGATIYLDYTIKTKAGYFPALDIFETIPQNSSVRDYILNVITPENVNLDYTLTVKKVKPLVKVVNGRKSTQWRLKNVPASSKEDFVSLSNGDVPYFAATTFASPKDALGVLYKQLNVAPFPQLKDLAQRLTKNQKENDGKVKAIWNYVNYQIASSPLTLEQTGFRIRSLDEVLNSVYGTDLEKFSLLLGLLKAAEFKVEPVVTYPVPMAKGLGLCAINGFYALIEGTPYFINAKNLSRPADVLCGSVPFLHMDDGECERFSGSDDCKITGNYEIAVDKSGAKLLSQEKVGNNLLPYFKKGDLRKNDKLPVVCQGDYVTLVLPESSFGVNHLSFGRLNSLREGNLFIPRKVDETYTYTLECPSDVELRSVVKNSTIENTAGRLSISMNKSKGHLVVVRCLKLNKQLYTPGEYQSLRKLLISWYDKNSRTLLFRTK